MEDWLMCFTTRKSCHISHECPLCPCLGLFLGRRGRQRSPSRRTCPYPSTGGTLKSPSLRCASLMRGWSYPKAHAEPCGSRTSLKVLANICVLYRRLRLFPSIQLGGAPCWHTWLALVVQQRGCQTRWPILAFRCVSGPLWEWELG